MQGNSYLPEVSIIIPVKNVAKYINKCLDSLLAQTYPAEKFEILILDNFSDDGTIEIVESYPAGKVRMIQCGVDSPPVKYNKVIPKIKSGLIAFADGDAYFDSRWLEKTVEPLREETVAGAMGKVKTANPQFITALAAGYEFEDRFDRLGREVMRTQTMHSVYKRKIIEEAGLFDEELKTGYDNELGWRLNGRGYKIIYVPDAIAYHNHRPTVRSYYKQQYEYAVYAVVRNIKKPKIATGDRFASPWLTMQPLFYYFAVILALLSFFKYIPASYILAPAAVLTAVYVYSGSRLAVKFADLKALFIVILSFVRGAAFSLGIMRGMLKICLKI